ncbi:MAG: DUF2304 domain-containing protein [Thermoleophilaceae bacterium]|nr:DUF2304 domain-containing protein [Thermoleophilaceae bacterium]
MTAIQNIPLAASTLDGRLQAVAIIATAGMLLVVLEMVRQRRLMERYSLLWLAAAAVLLLLAVFSGILGKFSAAIGIATPSNALFLVAFGFVILVLLHFSVTISRLVDQTKVLAQKLAITEERLRRAESNADAKPQSLDNDE